MWYNSSAMANLVERFRSRCGDFWWYSLLIFIACRSGDAIQAFIGLWLVPRYVPQNELGAVLPLLQVGSIFGLPLSILVIPFARWLTLYAAQGEFGKVKRLLSLTFGFVVIVFILAVILARFILPHFFERLRVVEGSLGILVICAGLSGPFSSVFNNALQGLKRFGAIAFVNAISAPVRLVVMLVAMPFRALSGYMAAQFAAPAFSVVFSWFSLRKELGRSIKSVPLGRSDMVAMFRYTMPVVVFSVVCTFMGVWQNVLIRQRLPEIESAAFYIISRLAEIASYAGMSLTVVAFPLATEAGVAEKKSQRLFWRFLGGSFVAGFAVTLVFAICGKWLLELVPLWRDYAVYWPLLVVYTFRATLLATLGAFSAYEVAAGRFSFLWYWLPFSIVETGGLGMLTGFGIFNGILPDAVVHWMASLPAARLEFFVWWLLSFSTLQLLAVAGQLVIRCHKERDKSIMQIGEKR